MTTKEIVKERLEELAREHDGRLTPEIVVADAKQKDSPLHDLFEWDVKKAAYKYWLDTARNIIASVEVVIKTEHITVRAPLYVRDPSKQHKEQGYISVESLRSDQDLAREALVTEFQRAADLLRRARHLAVALKLDRDVDDVVDRVVGLKERAMHPEQRAAA